MSRLLPWLIAFALGALVSAALTVRFVRHDGPAPAERVERIESTLALSDAELLERRESILDEWKGEPESFVLQALLACIGYRLAKTPPEPEGRASPTPIPTPEPAPSAVRTEAAFSRHGFFCRVLQGTPALVDPAKWLQLFKIESPSSSQSATFGFVESLTGEEQAFLDDRICTNPVFWKLPMGPRNRAESRFLSRLGGRAFSGGIEIQGAVRVRHRMHLHFNQPHAREPEREYWVVENLSPRSRGEEPVENRYTQVSPDPSGPWVSNACSRSISLLGDFCPWLEDADLEFKDFFLVNDNQQILGNVYCRKRKDKSWVRVGTLQLRPGEN